MDEISGSFFERMWNPSTDIRLVVAVNNISVIFGARLNNSPLDRDRNGMPQDAIEELIKARTGRTLTVIQADQWARPFMPKVESDRIFLFDEYGKKC